MLMEMEKESPMAYRCFLTEALVMMMMMMISSRNKRSTTTKCEQSVKRKINTMWASLLLYNTGACQIPNL